MTTTSKYAALAREALAEATGLPVGSMRPEVVRGVARALERAGVERAIQELETFGEWVRRGDYNADDARDEIARAVENRTRELAELDAEAKR